MSKRDAGLLRQVGTQEDGTVVLGGVYKFFETHGIPLPDLLSILAERRAMPCWPSFLEEARAAGMKDDRVLSRVEEAAYDAYGPELAGGVMLRLRAWVAARAR